MEQLKILEIINRWGYLNTYQISILLNKNFWTTKNLLEVLLSKKLLRVDQLTRKNIYMLSSLGNRKLGKESKTIKINYNELFHQDLLIKWVSSQKDILSYQTEKELKAENPREKGYPDLLVHYDNKTMIVELERTRKTIKTFRKKIDGLRHYLEDNIKILWLVPNESMRKFIYQQILAYKWKSELHHIEIFNG